VAQAYVTHAYNAVMAVRITVDIPEPLHDMLRHKASQSGSSIRALIIQAIEQTYGTRDKAAYMTGPPVTGKAKLGPSFPKDENPHELVFS
jgi:hypothetical protein